MPVDESMGSKFKQWEETESNDEELSRGAAESMPFSFQPQQGSREIWPASLAYVTDLQGVIFHLTEEKER